jgi:hypothetical protein
MNLPLLTPTRTLSGHQPDRTKRAATGCPRAARSSASRRIGPRGSHQPMSVEQRSRHGVHGSYLDREGRPRDLVTLPGAAGSLLVVDRDATTLEDRRLVGHLSAEEPSGNVELLCRHYLQDDAGRWCRRVLREDQHLDPEQEHECSERGVRELLTSQARDGRKYSYRLEPVSTGRSISQLRWCGHLCEQPPADPRPVSMREVIAALESYEPVRRVTVEALAHHRHDPEVSVATLRAELERMDASRIVLNRGLRLAVLSAVGPDGLSMSQIAIRCGRIKYDANGNASGETSWLARRVGLLPEGGGSTPTPWIHSEVLGLIARRGLGISPREVELG